MFPVFTSGGGFGMREMEGAADVLMVADPTTFRVLPWAPATGWLLCDIYFADGRPVPFATRNLYPTVLDKLGSARLRFRRRPRGRIPHLQARRRAHGAGGCRPAGPAAVGQPAVARLSISDRAALRPDGAGAGDRPPRCRWRSACRLRSVEVEFGPSQCEFTFKPTAGLEPADNMVLFRSAVKQIAAATAITPPSCAGRNCRTCSPPAGICTSRSSRATAARTPSWPRKAARRLSAFGRAYLAGLLDARPRLGRVHDADHQRLQALPLLFAGAGPRDLGPRQPRRDGPRARRRRRCRDAAGKPDRRARRQSLSLHGLADSVGARWRRSRARSRPVRGHALRDQGGAVAEVACAKRCSRSKDDPFFREALGAAFVDYYVHIKNAEIERFQAEVSDWEHREYFEMF